MAPTPSDAVLAGRTSGRWRWPVALILDQVLGRAGLRLVAIPAADPGGPPRPGPRPSRAAGEQAPRMAGHPQFDQPVRPPRVLLVDDSPAIRAVLRGLLEDAGMQVIAKAADGLEGVAQAEAVRPDVVLMDWRMPLLNGVQATARIRRQLPQVQVVMFSFAENTGGDRPSGWRERVCAQGAPAEQVCAACWPPTGRRPPYPLTTLALSCGEPTSAVRSTCLHRSTTRTLHSPPPGSRSSSALPRPDVQGDLVILVQGSRFGHICLE